MKNNKKRKIILSLTSTEIVANGGELYYRVSYADNKAMKNAVSFVAGVDYPSEKIKWKEKKKSEEITIGGLKKGKTYYVKVAFYVWDEHYETEYPAFCTKKIKVR